VKVATELALKIARAAIALLMSTAAVAAAQPSPGGPKTLAECIEIALANRPNLEAAAADLDAGRARVRQQWSGYLPQVDGAYSSDRSKSSFESRTQSPDTINAFDRATVSNFHTGSVSLSQTIFDFGQNLAAIRAAYAREDSLEADAATTRKQVIYEVKQSYFDLLAARRLLEVADETVRSNRKQLEQAVGRNEVGFAPRIDVTRSEVALAQAELDQLSARNNATVAGETLRNALGLDAPLDFDIADELGRRAVVQGEPEAIAAAYESRSDLQSVLAQQRAAEQDVSQFRREHFPTISADASYGYSNSEFPLDDNWVVGASVNVPIFSGGLTEGRVAEARANLRGLKADERTLRQQLGLEVRRSLLDVQRASQSIDVSERAAKQAGENLELAEGRYETGVGNVIELSDAQTQRASAEADRVRALYDYQVAVAALEQAIGRELPSP
jgi:outer membrane protein TolC